MNTQQKNQEKEQQMSKEEEKEMEKYDLIELLHDFTYQTYLQDYYQNKYPYEMDLENAILKESTNYYSWTGVDWWESDKQIEKELDRIIDEMYKLGISDEFEETVDEATEDVEKFLAKVKE